MPYVNVRWLGGTLTNFRTIRSRIDYLLKLEERQASGELDKLPKKEALMLTRELAKLQVRLGGLKEMRRLPKALFIIDTRHEENAIKEALTLEIPLVAMCDTNSNPDPIAYPIPSNDDAIRAIKLLTGKIADAAIEGKNIRGVIAAETEEDTGIAAEPMAEVLEMETAETPEESEETITEIEADEAGEGEAL